jgi:hypothetical protein
VKYVLIIAFIHLGAWSWETDATEKIQYASKVLCEKEAARMDAKDGIRAYCVEVR